MGAIGTEIVLILLLVLANGVLAMAEIALVSSRKARLKQRADEGDRGARAALELARDPGRFLSTVQIGITLVGILAGAFGGATLAEQLGAVVARFPPLAPWSEALGIGAVVLGITFLSLILGELVPKQIGLNAPEGIAAVLARPLRLLAWVSAPAVHLLDGTSRLVVRLLGIKPSTEPPITEEELRILLEQGRRAGVFERAEQQIVERVLRLGDWRIADLATPRLRMVALDVNAPPEESWTRIAASGHTWFPLHEGNLDRILGLVSLKALWAKMAAGETPDLRALAEEPLYLFESLPVFRALDRFRKQGHEAALVLDEYGGVEGMVTLDGVLQAIVGELATPEESEPMVRQREDGSWLIDGMLLTDELESLLHLPRSEAEELEEFQTLGGFAMGRIGRIPQAGDHFEWAGFRFEVVDMDGRRVDRVLVQPQPVPPSP